MKRLNLNSFRVVCAILVIAIHTSPLDSLNPHLDHILVSILSRIAVPFFLMISGYYTIPKLIYNNEALVSFIKRIIFLYFISVIIYLPINMYSNHFTDLSVLGLLKLLFIDGSMYHLWYFPALILGTLLVISIIRSSFKYKLTLVSGLYLIGLLGDSYYHLIETVPFIKGFYDYIFTIFEFTRNGVFYVPIFLYLGYLLATKEIKYLKKYNTLLTLVFLSLLLFEGLLVKKYQLARHDSMYIMLVPHVVLVFNALIHKVNSRNKNLSMITTITYIIHPMVIVAIRLVAKIFHIEDYLITPSFIFFLMVCLLSFMFSILCIHLLNRFNRTKPISKGRVWKTLNYSHLKSNIQEITRLKHQDTKIMAVVKANAYGHGSINVSKYLSSIGIKDFAVASLDEAIELREAGLRENILILGYTSPQEISKVIKYDLIQTIVDYNHALDIASLKLKQALKCHIKVNTGMNRLGESHLNISNIEKMYHMQCLNVLGIFSHLSCADSLEDEDIKFTEQQIAYYDHCITQLKTKGIDPKATHLQGSYGFSNYPHLKYDFIRIGIMMYGVKSSVDDLCPLDLKPVLDLRASIASIKEISENESVSYGRDFTSSKKTKLATITLGYADGLPRSLSNQSFNVFIKDIAAPVIGRICMDQCVIDVSHISDISLFDEVIIFNDKHSVEVLASIANTITNDILSTLSKRIRESKSYN